MKSQILEQLKWASFVMCGAAGTKLKRLEPHFNRTWVFCVLMKSGPREMIQKGGREHQRQM